ncbi:MAG: hypothetical protein KAR38_10955, partial [Calditrichia bacterium]|nr:hypothetical protein [Calditrichia bacterium]
NDFLNNHEGDWEHINVIIDNQNPATASIIEVDYYFHHHVLTVNSPEVDFRLFDQTHPVVFVGGYSGVSDGWGSHGSYPTTGLWIAAAYDTRNDIEDGIYISEIVTSDGNYLKYNEFELTILPEPDVINYNTHPEMSWLSARLYWGELLVPSPGYEELEKLREKLRKIESITGGLIDYNLPNDVGNNPPWGPKWNAGWNHTGAVGEAFINYTQTPPQLTNWQPPY